MVEGNEERGRGLQRSADLPSSFGGLPGGWNDSTGDDGLFRGASSLGRDASSLVPGLRLGQYQLESELGSGGMGVTESRARAVADRVEREESMNRPGEAGSWAPAVAWGHAGGRVYSTAVVVLALQALHTSDG